MTSSSVVLDSRMNMYVATREFDAVSSDEDMEKLVEPKEKELLLTYIAAVASYFGFMRNAVTAKVAAPAISAVSTSTSALLHSTLNSAKRSISISSFSFLTAIYRSSLQAVRYNAVEIIRVVLEKKSCRLFYVQLAHDLVEVAQAVHSVIHEFSY